MNDVTEHTITLEHATATSVQIVIGYGGMGQHCIDVYPRLSRIGTVIVVDPESGRAKTGAERLQSMGVEAKFIEAPIQEVKILEHGQPNGSRMVMNWMTDGPEPPAWGLRQYPNCAHQIQLYTKMPNGVLYGKSMTVKAGDNCMQNDLADFFEAVQRVAANTGSDFIWGRRGRAEHRSAEPLYRNWNRELMLSSLQRLVSGRELSIDSVQITGDGRETMPLLIQNHRNGWRSPEDIAEELISSSDQPLIRGSSFAVGEIGPDGIRIHRARLRKLDGQIYMEGFPTLNRAAVTEALRRAEQWSA